MKHKSNREENSKVLNEDDDTPKFSYYSVAKHSAWLWFLLIFSTVCCFFCFPWGFKALITFCPYIIPSISVNDFIPNFLAGMLGIILGFLLDAVFIRRLKLLFDYIGIRYCLIADLKDVVHVCSVNGTNLAYEKCELLYKNIEKYFSNVDNRSILYNLPRYIKRKSRKGIYAIKLGNILGLLQDIKDNNKKTNSKIEDIINTSIELLMRIDDNVSIYKQKAVNIIENNIILIMNNYIQITDVDFDNIINISKKLYLKRGDLLKSVKKIGKNETYKIYKDEFLSKFNDLCKKNWQKTKNKSLRQFIYSSAFEKYTKESMIYCYCGYEP